MAGSKRFLMGLAGMSLLLAGCDASFVDPFDNEGKYFTVYGFLDELSTIHRVRVIDLARTPRIITSESDPDAFLDAEVFSTDMLSGVRTPWTHQLDRLEDGTYGHVFTSQFLVTPGRQYRLEVVRKDGKMATAQTRVPEIKSTPIVVRDAPIVDATSREIVQDVTITGVVSPWDVNVIYTLGVGINNYRVFVPYGRPGSLGRDGNWHFRMHVSDDVVAREAKFQQLIDLGVSEGTTPYNVVSIGIQIRILNAQWRPPHDAIDVEQLAQPGAFSNVENGYGFFGSVGLYAEEWLSADDDLLDDLRGN